MPAIYRILSSRGVRLLLYYKYNIIKKAEPEKLLKE